MTSMMMMMMMLSKIMMVIIIIIMIVVMMMIVMAYDKSRDGDDNYSHDYDNNSRDGDDDNIDTGGMNDMIFRSTNIYYNQYHDISHLLELHDEVLMVVTMAIMMMIITMI
jgi:hypothetical protein